MKTNVKNGLEKEQNKDFTKLTHKKGISLIVLIVTIIVIIILAAAVILTISKNNPVESAREATFKEDVRSFQDELALTIAKEYTDKQGQRDTKINATASEVTNYIPSFKKEYVGKFVIVNDQLIYVEDKVNDKEKTWCNDLGIGAQVKTAAQKVSENVAEYYGQNITNYSANGVSGWKIFYADENNVYIIASDYVEPTLLPTKDGTSLNISGSSYPKAAYFNNIIGKYNGSTDITDAKIQALNSDYFSKGYISTNNNMKAVAYMLDTKIWSSFATDKTEYAIGGPTVEMFFKSYNQKYKVDGIDYRAQAISATGYKISKDGGANWATYYNSMLKTDDDLYVLPASSGASAMWLGSPPAANSGHAMFISYSGNVSNCSYGTNTLGFRPIVSLKSDITLKPVEGGFEIQ